MQIYFNGMSNNRYFKETRSNDQANGPKSEKISVIIFVL